MSLDLRELHAHERAVAVASTITGIRRELTRTLSALRSGLLHLRRRLPGAAEGAEDPRLGDLFSLMVAELDDAEDTVAALRCAPLPAGEARADLREALTLAAAGLLPPGAELGVSCPEGVTIAASEVELALLLRCVLANTAMPLRHLEILVELTSESAELILHAAQGTRDPLLARMIERSLCLAAATMVIDAAGVRVRLPLVDPAGEPSPAGPRR